MRTLTLLFASIWCPLISFSQEKTGVEKLVSSYESLQKTSKDSIAQRIFSLLIQQILKNFSLVLFLTDFAQQN